MCVCVGGVHYGYLCGWCTSCVSVWVVYIMCICVGGVHHVCLCGWCTSCVFVWVVYITCICVGGVYHMCLCGWCTSCGFVSAVWAKNGRKSIDDFSYNKGNTGQSCWLDWNRNARDRSVQLLLYSSVKTSTLCKTCHWINQLLLLLEISKRHTYFESCLLLQIWLCSHIWVK